MSPAVICTQDGSFVDNTGAELEKHPDLWFPDGSVIIAAENTVFRVHMSLLSLHSVCFRDMFEMPQPTVGPTEECPIIRLHDSAEDTINLLKAIYIGPNFGDNDPEDFRVVSGVLRLSTKYICDSLRVKAIAHLETAWPPTLRGWDTREDIARAYELETGNHPGTRFPSPIAVLRLAKEAQAPSLLPSAYYDLSRYSYSQIFEPNEDDVFCASDSTLLTVEDMQRLSLGKEATHQAITSVIQALGQSQSIRHPQQHSAHRKSRSAGTICVSAAACRKVKRFFPINHQPLICVQDFAELVDLATQHYLFDRERGCLDPLYVAEELGQLKSAEFSNECEACCKSLEVWASSQRNRMWKLIPQWFRLPSF